jgi:hypothetical protein
MVELSKRIANPLRALLQKWALQQTSDCLGVGALCSGGAATHRNHDFLSFSAP